MLLLSITLATVFSNVIYNYEQKIHESKKIGKFFLFPVKLCFVEIQGFERIATLCTKAQMP